MMTTIGTRPYPDDGAAVIGRAATMPPATGPGRPGRASPTRLHLTVAAAGGLLAAGMIAAAAAAGAAGAAADRALHCRAGNRRHPTGHGTASQPSPAAGTGR